MLAKLAAALQPVLARPDVDVAALFGSAVSGRLRPDSDVDVYVRLARGTRWTARERRAVADEAARACGRDVDLVVEDPSTSVILRREVAATGWLLHESEPGAWVDVRASAMLAYVDLEPYLRFIGDSIRESVRRG